MSRKRRLVSLLILLTLSTWLSPDIQSSYADSPPTSPGTGFYVRQYWDELTPWDGGTKLKAYRKGWHVNSGSPNPTVLLEFGRQLYSPTSGWGVVPIGQTYRSNEWVRMIAQAFIDGYNDNPAHSYARIAVGTNNSNYNWYCNNNDPANLSPNWRVAGYVWGQLITSISNRPKVHVVSGNDIESWNGTFSDGWVACGFGAVAWYDGYEETSGLRENYNFGTNGNQEYSPQWTRQQVYDVAWGRVSAYMYPQIYCYGVAPTWVNIRNVGYMRFFGVTSDNARSSLCGYPTLTWQQSWSDLDYHLTQGGYPNYLISTAIDFFPLGW